MNQTTANTAIRISGKSKDILVLLSAFLGAFGVDRFFGARSG